MSFITSEDIEQRRILTEAAERLNLQRHTKCDPRNPSGPLHEDAYVRCDMVDTYVALLVTLARQQYRSVGVTIDTEGREALSVSCTLGLIMGQDTVDPVFRDLLVEAVGVVAPGTNLHLTSRNMPTYDYALGSLPRLTGYMSCLNAHATFFV